MQDNIAEAAINIILHDKKAFGFPSLRIIVLPFYQPLERLNGMRIWGTNTDRPDRSLKIITIRQTTCASHLIVTVWMKRDK
jgi:hypothetical protein